MGVGYPDFQRVENWDGDQVGVEAQAFGGTLVLGPYFMGRWARIGLAMSINAGNNVAVNLYWYADQAQTRLMGHEGISLSASIPNPWWGAIDNRGPWLVITAIRVGGAACTMTLRALPTNRQSVRPAALPIATAMRVSGLNVPGGGSSPSQHPEYYAGGPALIYVTAQSGSVTVSLTDEDADLFDHPFYSLNVGNGGVFQAANLVLPAGAWRMDASNAGGVAASLTVTVIPSPTGAAGG